ncbi:MAG TPA: hydrogen peroxide-inducible genes activator [Paludibacteraceae bacterium]|nr:hydrogen peroxide-inducible genes activator [Paludibacteraceae bacterium]
MTLQQIEYIVTLNRHRHFVKAAEECGVTQPTLSTMVQKLEEELDVKIFDRSKYPIAPTAIGEKVIRQAEITLNEVRRIHEVVNDEINSLTGTLKIGIIPTIAPYLVPEFITRFRSEYEGITLTISEMRTTDVLEQLQIGNLDLAIISTPLEQPDILEIPLYYEKFVAYFSPTQRFTEIPLNPKDMPLDDLWVLQEGHCARRQIFNFCHAETSNHMYEAGSIDTLVKIVDKSGGYTMIPELHLQFLTEKQLKNVREINSPPAVREVSIVIRHDFVKERMINAVANTVKKIIPLQMLDERLKKFSIRLK